MDTIEDPDEYIREPKDKLIRFGPEVAINIRKEYNMSKKEDREKSIAIIDEWIQQQDHFLKKDFRKSFIEKSIITSKCSLERAKKQIDTYCTVRTLMPQYFQVTNLKESDVMTFLNKVYCAVMPNLTKEYYRTILVKIKPNAEMKSTDSLLFLKFLAVLAEYLKLYDCCNGYYIIGDFYDTSVADVLTKLSLVELQHFIPIITEGYGGKIKGIFLVTSSKFIEGFIKLLKPLFSEKIGQRIHAVATKNTLQDLIQGDILPEEYGGTEKPVEELHEKLIEGLSTIEIQELLKETNKAATDETKRRIDKFNDQYMGMPGSFRTLSLD